MSVHLESKDSREAMASHDEAAVAPASKDGADVPMATDNKVTTPTTPEIEEDQMSLDDENLSLSPSISHGQIDGNTDTEFKNYVPQPPNLIYAQVQGLARLQEMLNDPDGDIARQIQKTSGWNAKSLASNEKCKKVRHLLTDKEVPITDKTVPFILATWCMLGGFIPSMWHDKVEGAKRGSKTALSESGKKMVNELDKLGGSGNFEFELCNRYTSEAHTKKVDFDWAKFSKSLEKSNDDASQDKKAKSTARKASLGKHVASSPRQSPASKRQKIEAANQTQEVEGSNTPLEDEAEESDQPSESEDEDESEAESIEAWNRDRATSEWPHDPDATWRDHAPPNRPGPDIGFSLNEIESLANEVKNMQKVETKRKQIEIWNNLLLKAHRYIDYGKPDQKTTQDIAEMVAFAGQALTLATDEDPSVMKWKGYKTTFFESHTEKKKLGQCHFCPAEYVVLDSIPPQDQHHKPQQYLMHQLNLCHDSAEELKARKEYAKFRLGRSGTTYRGFNNDYHSHVVAAAVKLITRLQRWNNQLHRFQWTHDIVAKAKEGDEQGLRVLMLALRACLFTGIVPPLVAEPSYMLEKIRHEVNQLGLRPADPDLCAPDTQLCDAKPHFHKIYNDDNFVDHADDAERWERRCLRQPQGELPTPDYPDVSQRHVWNEAAAFSNSKYVQDSMAQICFPVGCSKNKDHRVIVVCYDDFDVQPEQGLEEARKYLKTRHTHLGLRFKHPANPKEVVMDEQVEFDEIQFHSIFAGRDELFIDDIAYFIYKHNFARLFEALEWAENNYRARLTHKEYGLGPAIPVPKQHKCPLYIDLDCVLSKDKVNDRLVPKALTVQPARLDSPLFKWPGKTVEMFYDSVTAKSIEAIYRNDRAQEKAWAKEDDSPVLTRSRIYETEPEIIEKGVVFDHVDLGIRVTYIGPLNYDQEWYSQRFDVFDFFTGGIRVKRDFKGSLPPFVISMIPTRFERFNYLDGDAAIDAWLAHVKDSKLGANGEEPSLIPYQRLPKYRIHCWPFVKPLGDHWLERSFTAWFTAYGGVPNLRWKPKLNSSVTKRLVYYLTVVDPVRRRREVDFKLADRLPKKTREKKAEANSRKGPVKATQSKELTSMSGQSAHVEQGDASKESTQPKTTSREPAYSGEEQGAKNIPGIQGVPPSSLSTGQDRPATVSSRDHSGQVQQGHYGPNAKPRSYGPGLKKPNDGSSQTEAPRSLSNQGNVKARATGSMEAPKPFLQYSFGSIESPMSRLGHSMSGVSLSSLPGPAISSGHSSDLPGTHPRFGASDKPSYASSYPAPPLMSSTSNPFSAAQTIVPPRPGNRGRDPGNALGDKDTFSSQSSSAPAPRSDPDAQSGADVTQAKSRPNILQGKQSVSVQTDPDTTTQSDGFPSTLRALQIQMTLNENLDRANKALQLDVEDKTIDIRVLEREVKKLKQQVKDKDQVIADKDNRIAEITASEGSDGVFTYRSKGALEVDIDKLKTQIDELEKDKAAQKRVLQCALNDNFAYQTTIAESKPGASVARIAREHEEQAEEIRRLGRQDIEHRAKISRLDDEVTAYRRLLTTSEEQIEGFQKQSKAQNAPGVDEAQLARNNAALLELNRINTSLREELGRSEEAVAQQKRVLDSTTIGDVLAAFSNVRNSPNTMSLSELLEKMPEEDYSDDSRGDGDGD